MELPNILRLVGELQGRDPDRGTIRAIRRILADLKPEKFRQLGEKYLDDTRVYRTGKPMFIDKMPNNFRHIGLIHLILPNAKIIDARRERHGVLLQQFQAAVRLRPGVHVQHRGHRALLSQLRGTHAALGPVLPGKVLRVQHENVVEDLEGNVRRMLEFCGLEFEPACLEFHRTERSVRTASSEQVRQPISKEGLEQWRHFEPWLGELKMALGPRAEA